MFCNDADVAAVLDDEAIPVFDDDVAAALVPAVPHDDVTATISSQLITLISHNYCRSVSL